MRFLGNIEAKTDAKGRVFLPATFRKVLQASGQEALIMRKDVFQDCLKLYPESVWNEQMDLLRGRLNRYNRQHQAMYGMLMMPKECREDRTTIYGCGLFRTGFGRSDGIRRIVKLGIRDE